MLQLLWRCMTDRAGVHPMPQPEPSACAYYEIIVTLLLLLSLPFGGQMARSIGTRGRLSTPWFSVTWCSAWTVVTYVRTATLRCRPRPVNHTTAGAEPCEQDHSTGCTASPRQQSQWWKPAACGLLELSFICDFFDTRTWRFEVAFAQ